MKEKYNNFIGYSVDRIERVIGNSEDAEYITGSFSYAALRYKEIKPMCLDDISKCPDRELCKSCVHDECKNKVTV